MDKFRTRRDLTMKYIWKIQDKYMRFDTFKFSKYFHSFLNCPVADRTFTLYHKFISTPRS